jgi:hypothetical protein
MQTFKHIPNFYISVNRDAEHHWHLGHHAWNRHSTVLRNYFLVLLLIYSVLIDILFFILGRANDTPGKSCLIKICLFRVSDNKANAFSPSVTWWDSFFEASSGIHVFPYTLRSPLKWKYVYVFAVLGTLSALYTTPSVELTAKLRGWNSLLANPFRLQNMFTAEVLLKNA